MVSPRIKRTILAAFLALFVATTFAYGLWPRFFSQTSSDEISAAPRPLVLVGIDGADWRVIRPLMKQNRMPTMAKLVDEGATGVLLAPKMYPYSAQSWTSIATGKHVERHGVTRNVPVPRDRVKATPFWEAAANLGRRVGIVNWICNYGAVLPEGSVMISGPYKVGFYPPDLEQQVSQWVGPYHGDIDSRMISDRFLSSATEVEKARTDVALRLLERNFDIFSVVFSSTDRVSHFFWKYYEPDSYKLDPGLLEKYRHAVENVYEEADRNLGRILSAIDGRANLMVVSDHGFQGIQQRQALSVHVMPNAILQEAGLALMRRDSGVDKRRSVAWTKGNIHQGIWTVQLSPEFPDRMDEVEAALSSFRLEGETRPLYNNFQWEGDLLRFSVPSRLLPEGPARVTMIIDGQPAKLPLERFLFHLLQRSGDHRHNGILALYGPDIEAGEDLGEADVYDVAPTAMVLAGLPVAEDMDGQVIRRAFANRRHPVTTIASYDALLPAPTSPQKDEAADTTIDEETRNKLRGLGYL